MYIWEISTEKQSQLLVSAQQACGQKYPQLKLIKICESSTNLWWFLLGICKLTEII